MSQAISKDKIKAIYALGGGLGIVEHGNHQDNLHLLVDGITGKDSVSRLTDAEADKVIGELKHRMRFGNQQPPPAKKPKRHPEKPGGVSSGQQRKVWALMYQLAKYDETPSAASLGTRLSGIIKNQFDIDATAEAPFAWLTYKDGNCLIERLKGYVGSAEKKAAARSGTHGSDHRHREPV